MAIDPPSDRTQPTFSKSPLVSVRSIAARLAQPCRSTSDVDIVVFSRDRAPQLDLLLRTYERHAKPRPRPVVLQYCASDPLHEESYAVLIKAHRSLISRAIREDGFKSTLLDILRPGRAKNVVFLVDDIVFVDAIDLELLATWPTDRSILSLRLGRNIKRSYNGRVAVQRQPPFTELHIGGQPALSWDWRRGELDWALPTSLDGNVLPAAEILPIVAAGDVRGPNSLEHELGRYRFLFKGRSGVCFATSRLVNLPLNTVKVEEGFSFPNLDVEPRGLAEGYLRGLRLSVEEYSCVRPDSCHMEWIPQFQRMQVLQP